MEYGMEYCSRSVAEVIDDIAIDAPESISSF